MFYYSVVLINKKGKIVCHYRKINEHKPYSKGNDIKIVETEFGKISILICGDLFDNSLNNFIIQIKVL